MWFFGCWDGTKGHYLYDQYRNKIRDFMFDRVFPYRNLKFIDGFMPSQAPQSHYVMIHFDDRLTMMLMSDYSADSRPGSNAGFLLGGKHDAEKVLEHASKIFPAQYERIKKAGEFTPYIYKD